MSKKTLVLGVDGGGSKTLGLVGDQQGNILSQREVRGTNPNVVGFETAAKTLFHLVHACCEDARCEPAELKALVFGIAGTGREADRKRLGDELNKLFEKENQKPLPMTVETDARVALEGAFDGGMGVVIIAGTGSIVIGKTPRGEIHTVGGWGRLLGDEGGGYFIGREAAVTLAQHFDGRADAGKLKDLFARKLGWEGRDRIIAAVYQDKFDLSLLAPLVLEAAAGNDVVAQRIVQRAATLLVEQARVVVMKMGITRKVGLVMVGGLVAKDSTYANVLHMKILKLLPQVDIRPAMHIPAHGAVLMALERLQKG